ncbi:MAG: nickel pincer cofactor biosynthesis protein LarC [Planctomycetes bacterium]|nr:nickel pincer cofactor biosynthesis protein LarC [Planctomycetota bacterium]
MKRILYLDAFSGISGDMFLGALVDAGLPLEPLLKGLKALAVEGYQISAQKVYRGPFHATRLKVHVNSGTGNRSPGNQHDHSHGHGHSHSHDHGHSPPKSAPEAVNPATERSYRTIVQLIRSSSLPERVQGLAIRVFTRLGEAEARVHGVPLDEVHFHEVGAVDSIVDIVGACFGLYYLDIETVWCSPITLGTGLAKGAHGTFPLPAPAALEVLKGVPVRQRDTGFELCTPTGAALAASLASGFGTFPPLRVSSIGYGAGDDRPGEVPNVLRVVIGESGEARERDRVVQIEANLDDASPQWLGYLQEQLLAAGALDVAITPVLMKKSRPGHLLTVLATPGKEAVLEDLIFQETPTFGLRKQEVERVILARDLVPVATPWGEVRVKVGRRGGAVVTAAPEYEDLKKLAQSTGQPIKELSRRVMEEFHRGVKSG